MTAHPADPLKPEMYAKLKELHLFCRQDDLQFLLLVFLDQENLNFEEGENKEEEEPK